MMQSLMHVLSCMEMHVMNDLKLIIAYYDISEKDFSTFKFLKMEVY